MYYRLQCKVNQCYSCFDVQVLLTVKQRLFFHVYLEKSLKTCLLHKNQEKIEEKLKPNMYIICIC